MNKKIIYCVIILFAILLQLSFLPLIIGASALGDAVLMLVLALAVIDGFTLSLSWAIVAGILYDFATYTTLGEHVIIFLLVAYVVSFFSRRLSVEVKGTGLLLLLLFIAVTTIISNWLLAIFLILGDKSIRFHMQAFGNFRLIVFQVCCNAIIFFLWYNLIGRIKKNIL